MKHVLIIAVIIGGALFFLMQNSQRVTNTVPDIGGAFDLVDVDGKQVTDKDFSGQYMALFFGFAHCPEVCPTALNTLSHVDEALKPMLQKSGKKLAYVFITVDPERDTPAEMKEYMTNFSEDIVGLTGTRAQVDAAQKAYNIYAKKIDMPEMETYMYNHSSFVYLMSPEGKYLAHVNHNMAVDEMVQEFKVKIGL